MGNSVVLITIEEVSQRLFEDLKNRLNTLGAPFDEEELEGGTRSLISGVVGSDAYIGYRCIRFGSLKGVWAEHESFLQDWVEKCEELKPKPLLSYTKISGDNAGEEFTSFISYGMKIGETKQLLSGSGPVLCRYNGPFGLKEIE